MRSQQGNIGVSSDKRDIRDFGNCVNSSLLFKKLKMMNQKTHCLFCISTPGAIYENNIPAGIRYI
jgi:hypothetical protein